MSTLLIPAQSAQGGAAVPAQAAPAQARPMTTQDARFTNAAGFDVSRPLRELAATARIATARPGNVEERPERGIVGTDRGHSPDAALQAKKPPRVIPGTLANFEGLSNQDNFNVFGGRVNPPDPVGDVGPNHYVEMINLVFGVFSKTGAPLLAPVDTGTLWAGFPVDECTEPSGDPIVIYDQFADRWILTQFTTRGINFPDEPANLFYNCVAISTTGDPTGSYFRYAFSTGFNFPDYPKYSVWDDSYLITTREFGIIDESIYGIGVYGLERDKMIAGDPNARAVGFLLQDGRVPINLFGDGLLPADSDGKRGPKAGSAAPIIGTQDDEGPYGATFDALNVWEFDVKWDAAPAASIALKAQLPVDEFDSMFPCAPTARDCLPQPGITDPNQFLDILSYRQRPTWRLAHRNFGSYEAMVTNQSVEATPGVAGVRWYEIRRKNGRYSVFQQGTYAPNDGVHRWMGSIAMDRKGNAALGYSVVNATDVFPGIRYTGRLAGDRRGQMTLGEATIASGTGVQTHTNSRWGDYTSMNVDPVDDCTFWYVNEYYTAAGQASAPNGWQTRIASFKLPKC
ncbi:MAG TPA: hypothetical protein VFR67_08560 [Pilimelia sp.]|nr:hypothetical protein [Pilimelia sp.]